MHASFRARRYFLAFALMIALPFSAQAGFIVASSSGVQSFDNNGGYSGLVLGNGSGGLDTAHGLLLSGGNLLISGNNNSVLSVELGSGMLNGSFTSGVNLSVARGMAFTSDGRLLVSAYGTGNILSFSGLSGNYLGVFASGLGLSGPAGMTRGVDGNIYVSDFNNSAILRFDELTGAARPGAGQTGAVFVASGSGGLNHPNMGLGFGLGGELLVSNFLGNNVLAFDSLTGAFQRTFIATGSGGLRNPQGFASDSNGNLLVASQGTGSILRYDGRTGQFIDKFADTGAGSPTNIINVSPNPDMTAVPEPATIVLFGSGVVSVLLVRGRRILRAG